MTPPRPHAITMPRPDDGDVLGPETGPVCTPSPEKMKKAPFPPVIPGAPTATRSGPTVQTDVPTREPAVATAGNVWRITPSASKM